MIANPGARAAAVRAVAGAILAALLATAVPGAGSAFAAAGGRTAVVTVDRLNLRAGPETDAEVVDVLERGDVVTVLDESDHWWQVRAADRTGYVYRQERFLSFAPPAEVAAAEDGTGSPGAPPVAADAAPSEADAEALKRRIARQERAVDAAEEEEARVIDQLERADRSLAEARTRHGRLTSEIEAIEKRIDEASRASRALRETIARDSAYVEQRLVALYKLGRIGNLQLLASAHSLSDLQRRRKALTAILDYDRQRLAEYHRKAALLGALGRELEQHRGQRQALAAEAEGALRAAAREEAAKRSLLEKVQTEKGLQVAALEALKQSARELDRAVARLQPPARPSPPAAASPDGSFRDSKGLLNLPVGGKIISFYGTYRHPTYNVTNFNGGIDIRAGRGEPVAAVWQGVVVYSDWFRGYGNLVIVNHGDSYHTLYAHLAERFKQKGDPVEKGEVIGTVGDTGPVKEPGLHFQVRHHGKAIDPLEWVRKG